MNDGVREESELADAMAAYQAGSVDAFDRLHDALASDVKAYLTALTRDPTRADDLVQETFLQLHRARASYLPGQPVRPWVFAIAKRVFLMQVRAAGRRTRYELDAAGSHAGDASFAADADRLQVRRDLETALRQIPPAGRRAFLLHHHLGLSFKEIGARMGITDSTAKIRSSRAAALLRALIGGTRAD